MSQIEAASQVPAGHSLFDEFSAQCGYKAKKQSDCGIIVLKLNMLRLAGHIKVPVHWLLPLTAQQKLKYESCIVQVDVHHTLDFCVCPSTQKDIPFYRGVLYYVRLQLLLNVVWLRAHCTAKTK